MTVPLRNLPFQQLDKLLSNLFTRAVKVDGTAYPSATLINMMNGFNRILRRTSDIRSLKGEGKSLEKDFNIGAHSAFARTRMVVSVAFT